MKQEIDSRVTIRLFYGCPLVPELRAQLEKSQKWKLAKIGTDKSPLAIVHHQEKDYCGRYLEGGGLTIGAVEAEERYIHNSINEFCPEFNIETLNFSLFPIVLIQ